MCALTAVWRSGDNTAEPEDGIHIVKQRQKASLHPLSCVYRSDPCHTSEGLRQRLPTEQSLDE